MQHISPQGEGRQVYGKGGQAGTLVSATQRNEMLCGSAKGCICGVPHRNGAAAGAARATYVDRAMTPPPQPQDCLPYLASPPAPVAPRQAFSALLLPSSPCHALPCPSLPYPALPCPTLSCLTLPYPTVPYPYPVLTGVPLFGEFPSERRPLTAANPACHLRVVLEKAVVQEGSVVEVLRRNVVHSPGQKPAQHGLNKFAESVRDTAAVGPRKGRVRQGKEGQGRVR